MTTTTLEATVDVTFDILQVALWVGLGALAGLVASYVVTALVRGLNRRHPDAGMIVRRGRRPFQLSLVVTGGMVAFTLATQVPTGIRAPGWRDPTLHALLIVLIVALTWFLTAMVRVVEDTALARVNRDVVTTRSRRVQTQAQVLRRVGVAIVWTVGIAAALLTFPGARAAGASLLASAGIISVVAGLAAQTTLSNVFAGIQLAFTDAIRVDDVVIVQGEFGYIEEITLTYVVVRLWDDRRMIMPSTYFTTTPFENWTRQAPALLGTFEIDADWRVPIPAMRAELARLLKLTDLWDGRTGLLQVYDAVGGFIRLRVLVSGKDAGTLTDLKYFLREHLVDWLQTVAPYALPRTRYEQQEVVELADRRTDPMYQELREEITELAELDGDGAQPEDTLVAPPLPEDPDARREREAAARRARRRAARGDRRRFRAGEEPRPR
ncbi:MAG: mechanosensitive ion channel family protein, partial [Georgenia sp.]